MMKTRASIYAVGGGVLALALSLLFYFISGEPGTGLTVALFVLLPAVFITFGGYAGHRVDAANEKRRRQEAAIAEAEEYLAEMAHAAVAGNDWDMDIEASHIPTCWEIKDCVSASCPVFRKKNIRCWLIAGTFCENEVQGTFAKKIGDCSRCEVYQMAVSEQPVATIRESFNHLLWVINEQARLQDATETELQEHIVELERLEAEKREMAETDVLTGLHNYNHFNEHLRHEVTDAKRFGKVLALVMLDLENFKKVNEIYGYKKGDEILKALSSYLKKVAGGKNYVARFGNAEFAIVLPGSDGDTAVSLARKVSSHADEIVRETGLGAGELSLNAGVADYPDCASDDQSLVSAADAALFVARKSRESVAYFCDITESNLTGEDISRLQIRLRGAGINTLTALARAVDAADQYREDDRAELSRLAGGVASSLGMDDDEADLLTLAVSIHDIGKIGVPTEVLHKTDKLSPLEVDMIKRHPEIGQDILREARQIQELVLAILYHHERWDGHGYPEGLTGNKIPRMARIIGIFDAYRAMRCDRPYRRALSQDEAVMELRKGAGSQFDPELVELFISQLELDGGMELRNAG